MTAGNSTADHDITSEWVHLQYAERSSFVETYGYAGSQGAVHLEGVRFIPRGVPAHTLLIYMHPASTLQLLPVPRMAARLGAHVLCAGSRYQRNDTAAILEKIVCDLGAYIAHARQVWGYRHVVLAGWSGGGSLALFYQSQAENPDITHTPAGDPADLTTAGLIPADAVIFQAAHISRHRLLADMIDPSIQNENDPDARDPALDIYDRANPAQPPYSAAFLQQYRAMQQARIDRITQTVETTLARLRHKGGAEMERGFVTHRTVADPRFLDPHIDPNDRIAGQCWLGVPEVANNGPVGLGRFATLRSWLSQWSPRSQGDGLRAAARLKAPFLVIENSADDAVPQPHCPQIYQAAVHSDRRFAVIAGANHYYAGQPDLLHEATALTFDWLSDMGVPVR